MTRPQRLIARTYDDVINEKLGADALATARAGLPSWMREDHDADVQ